MWDVGPFEEDGKNKARKVSKARLGKYIFGNSATLVFKFLANRTIWKIL
jgi:hypothetical protein